MNAQCDIFVATVMYLLSAGRMLELGRRRFTNLKTERQPGKCYPVHLKSQPYVAHPDMTKSYSPM